MVVQSYVGGVFQVSFTGLMPMVRCYCLEAVGILFAAVLSCSVATDIGGA